MKLVELMHSEFAFAWVLQELRSTLQQELDFLREADNAERCAATLAHLHFCYVPKVVRKLCTSRILTSEFIQVE